MKRGMLGFFILPFFVLQLFLGLLGLGIFVYLVTTRTITNYLYVNYSLGIGTPVVTMEDLFITPSVLNYLGIVLFIFGIFFTLMVLYVMKEKSILHRRNAFNLLFYFLVYLTVYPFIMINSVYHYFRGIRKWR